MICVASYTHPACWTIVFWISFFNWRHNPELLSLHLLVNQTLFSVLVTCFENQLSTARMCFTHRSHQLLSAIDSFRARLRLSHRQYRFPFFFKTFYLGVRQSRFHLASFLCIQPNISGCRAHDTHSLSPWSCTTWPISITLRRSLGYHQQIVDCARRQAPKQGDISSSSASSLPAHSSASSMTFRVVV